MIVPQSLVQVIGHAGVEDGVHMLPEQGFHMSVHELCREAYRVRGDGMLTAQVQLPVGGGRGHGLKAKIREEGMPEGQQLIEIQPHGQADPATLAGHTLALCQQLPLVVVQIVVLAGVPGGKGLFAPIAPDEFPLAVKGIHRQPAGVGTALAGDDLHLMLKLGQLPGVQQTALGGSLVRLGVKRRPVCTHQAGNGGTDHLSADLLFKCPEHGVVQEGAPLYHDMLSQSVCAVGTDHLVQSIFHHADG